MSARLWAYRPNSFLFASGMVEWNDEWESGVDGDGSPAGPYLLLSELGFTREDVEAIEDARRMGRGALCGFPPDEPARRYDKALASLAARIEALLPPESVK